MDFINGEHCQQIIDAHFKHYADREELDADADRSLQQFNVTPFGEKNGHLGEYYHLEIVRTSGRKMRLFVKKILSQPNRPEYVHFVTRKEFDFYRWLQTEGLTSEASCLPKYYLSTETFIVLELLEKFRLSRRDNYAKTYLDYDHLKCAVVALAKFHSVVSTTQFKTLEFLEEAMFSSKLYMSSISKGVQQYLTHRNLRLEMEIFEKHTGDLMRVFENPQETHGFKVVSHGDLWSNNLLFAYSGETPIDCKLIDFQMTRLAEPAHDLCTLLIHSAFYENFGELTDLYYGQLSKELQGKMSRLDFDASIKRHAIYAVITRIIYAAFAAATQLRRDGKLLIPLDEVMSRNKHNFLIEVCAVDPEQNMIFDRLVESLSKLHDLRLTEDVVHRVVYRSGRNEAEMSGYGSECQDMVLTVTFNNGEEESEEVVRFPTAEPNYVYEYDGNANVYLQKCHLYLRKDLMVMENLEDVKLQNLRQPFGLDDVQDCLKILAGLHAISYGNPEIKYKYQTKHWESRTSALWGLFSVFNIKVNWSVVHQKLHLAPIFAQCVQHSSYNHEFIYFPKSKFDPDLIAEVNNCRVVLPDEMYQGSACEEVLAFLQSSTTSTFRQYYTEEMLAFYYNSFVNVLKANSIVVPFTRVEFVEKCKLFEGMAVIDALLYHQRALLAEKCRVFKMAEVFSEEMIRNNYDCDDVYREHVDDAIVQFCSIFKDAVENKL